MITWILLGGALSGAGVLMLVLIKETPSSQVATPISSQRG